MFRAGVEKYSWMKRGNLIYNGARRIKNSGQSNSFNKNSGNILSDTIPVIVSESKNTVQSIAFDVVSYTTLHDIGISFLLGLGTNIITGNNTALSSHETYKNETTYYELYSGESDDISKVLFSSVIGLDKEINS